MWVSHHLKNNCKWVSLSICLLEHFDKYAVGAKGVGDVLAISHSDAPDISYG